MAEEAGKASRIEKFNGTDFAYWRMQIEDYLYGRKLHLPLLGTKPKAMKDKEWALLDRQVLGVIRLILSRSVAHNVVKEKTTADLMKVQHIPELRRNLISVGQLDDEGHAILFVGGT